MKFQFMLDEFSINFKVYLTRVLNVVMHLVLGADISILNEMAVNRLVTHHHYNIIAKAHNDNFAHSISYQ